MSPDIDAMRRRLFNIAAPVAAVALIAPARAQTNPSPRMTLRAFGAVGDGHADDTVAVQAAIDHCMANNVGLFDDGGTYSVGPITFNGSNYTGPRDRQWVALVSFRGAGRFRTIFKARSGKFSGSVGVITARNTAGVTYESFGVDGNDATTAVGMDFAWIGGGDGHAGIAPSCENVFRDLLAQNCRSVGIILDQMGDSVISGIWGRGSPVEVSMQLPGGIIYGDNIQCGSGYLVISCQNGSIVNSGIFGGLLLGNNRGSFNELALQGCQFYPNPSTNRLIDSVERNGSHGTKAISANTCLFNGNAPLLAGRWWIGGRFMNCHFTQTTFYDPNFSAAAGTGYPPKFIYQQCSFLGGQPPSRVPDPRNAANTVVQSELDHCYLAATGGAVDQTKHLRDLLEVSNTIRALPAANGAIGAVQVGTTQANGFRGIFAKLETYGNGYVAPAIQWSVNNTTMDWIETTINSLNGSSGSADALTITNGADAGGPHLRCAVSPRPKVDNSTSLGTASYRWSVVYAATGVINGADERERTAIERCDLGLSFVNSLQPVSYRLRVRESSMEHETVQQAGVRRHYGLSAQQVQSVLKGKDFAGLVHDPAADRFGLRYDQFIGPMIKAIQELSDQVSELKARIAELSRNRP